ncbi:DedA family protein [Acidomonas methanolica]
MRRSYSGLRTKASRAKAVALDFRSRSVASPGTISLSGGQGYSPLLHVFQHLLNQYGYGVIGLVVMLEAMGLPLPAESIIIGSSLYAAGSHHLEIRWIVVSAVVGAIMGDNFGYLIGKALGHRLLERYGGRVGITEDRLLLGRYLFRKCGGLIVFIGRFIAVLRVFVALLAGANRMPWHSFLLYNALGGIVWAGGYAVAAYVLGKQFLRLSGTVAIVAGVCAVIAAVSVFFFFKHNEKRLTEEAIADAKLQDAGGHGHRRRGRGKSL